MRKRTYVGVLMAVALSTGCSAAANSSGTAENTKPAGTGHTAAHTLDASNESNSDQTDSDNDAKNDTENENPAEQAQLTEVPAGDGVTLVDYRTSLYLSDRGTIRQIDKETGKELAAYPFPQSPAGSHFCVYNGDLYAGISDENGTMEIWLGDQTTKTVSLLTELPDSAAFQDIYAYEGVLYLDYGTEIKAFPIQDDKNLGSEIPKDQVRFQIPEGYSTSRGTRFAPYAAAHGVPAIVCSTSDYRLLWEMNPVTQELGPQIGNGETETFWSIVHDGNIFYYRTDEEKGQIVMYNPEQNTQDVLYEEDEKQWPRLLQIQDGMLYCFVSQGSAGDENTLARYFQININTKEKTDLSAIQKAPGFSEFETLSYNPSFYAAEDAVYYQTVEEYTQKLVKMDPKSEEILWKAPVFQSNIPSLGSVEPWEYSYLSEDGNKTLAASYVEHLVLNGNESGDAAVNELLNEEFEKNKEYAENFGKETDEETFENAFPWEYQIRVSVPFAQNQYFSVLMNGYEYTGGAHGMPFRSAAVYDRQEGRALKLSDLISNTEEELKTMVSTAFRQPAEEGATFLSPDEVEAEVYERTTFDSDFYLSEDGIVFYYTPYDLGPYAAGFIEVTIPFEDFTWKADLGM